MKPLVIALFTLLVFSSCTLTMDYRERREAPVETAHYMTKDQVKQEFMTLEQDGQRAKFMALPMTEEEKERKENLDDMDTFIPEKYRKELNKPKLRGTPEMKTVVFDDVDLRQCMTSIKRQWNGTCTTFGGVAAMELKMCKPLVTDLSEKDSWKKYEKYSCHKFIEALSNSKICNEADWPQTNKNPYSKCKTNRHAGNIKAKYIRDSVDDSLYGLARGNPIYIGLSTPKDMLRGRTVINPKSAKSSGGHAVLIVGAVNDADILGGGYWIIKNSWGKHIGDNGVQYLPFHYCQRNDTYCVMWEIESVEHGEVEPYNPARYERKCKGWWVFKWCYWVKVK